MKDCERFENVIQSLIAGNPKLDDLEALIGHCKVCATCRELYEMHRALAEFGSRFDEMEPMDFADARRTIIQMTSAKSPRPSRRGLWRALLSPFTLRPLTAAALLGLIFFLGLFAPRFDNRGSAPSVDLADKAVINANLQNMQNSPYTFSNVAVRYISGNTVSLSFDVTRRVSIVEPEHSELVKGILMHAQVSPSFTGAVGHFQHIPAKDRVDF